LEAWDLVSIDGVTLPHDGIFSAGSMIINEDKYLYCLSHSDRRFTYPGPTELEQIELDLLFFG